MSTTFWRNCGSCCVPARPSLLMPFIDHPIARSGILTFPLYFFLWEEVVIAWSYIGEIWKVFHYHLDVGEEYPLTETALWHVAVVMKNNEMFSTPDCSMKVVSLETAVICSTYHLLLRYSVVECHIINVTMNTIVTCDILSVVRPETLRYPAT